VVLVVLVRLILPAPVAPTLSGRGHRDALGQAPTR
jgi:hypothetical protein